MLATASPSQKFQEMILYVAKESEGDPRFGATKLNKILFYADFSAYRKWGCSISGQEYQKLEWGPAPRHLVPAVEALEAAGECVQLKKLIALREPDLSLFSAGEIDLLRDVLDNLRDLNATEVSGLSHEFLGWQAAGHGETIPYETCLLGRPRELTAEEEEFARAVAAEYYEA